MRANKQCCRLSFLTLLSNETHLLHTKCVQVCYVLKNACPLIHLNVTPVHVPWQVNIIFYNCFFTSAIKIFKLTSHRYIMHCDIIQECSFKIQKARYSTALSTNRFSRYITPHFHLSRLQDYFWVFYFTPNWIKTKSGACRRFQRLSLLVILLITSKVTYISVHQIQRYIVAFGKISSLLVSIHLLNIMKASALQFASITKTKTCPSLHFLYPNGIKHCSIQFRTVKIIWPWIQSAQKQWE